MHWHVLLGRQVPPFKQRGLQSTKITTSTNMNMKSLWINSNMCFLLVVVVIDDVDVVVSDDVNVVVAVVGVGVVTTVATVVVLCWSKAIIIAPMAPAIIIDAIKQQNEQKGEHGQQKHFKYLVSLLF